MVSGSVPFNLLKYFFLVFLVIDEAKVLNITDDLIFRFAHKNVSLKVLLEIENKTPEWSMGQWHVMMGYNCKGRCNKRSQRSFVHTFKCYCDEICMTLGDCCYDYLSRCRPSTREYWSTNHHSIYRCIDDVVVISKCPNNYNNQMISRKCMSNASLPERIPVFDNTTKVSYQNMFCAKCHNATATTSSFWKLELEQCQTDEKQTNHTNTEGTKPSNETYCHFVAFPSKTQKKFSSKCISSRDPCSLCKPVDPFAYNKESEYWANKVCGLYKMPFQTGYAVKNNWENPHCSLCNKEYANICKKNVLLSLANGSSFLKISIKVPSKYLGMSSASMKILKKYLENYDKTRSIDLSSIFLFEPPTPKGSKPINDFILLQKESSTKRQNVQGNVNDTTTLQSLRPLNCSKTMLINITYVVFYKNLSIFIPFLGQMYSNGSYNRRQSGVEVCRQTIHEVEEISSITNRQILNFAGFALSFLAEIALLAIYFILKALRNRPGKILMSLTTCLIVYQVLYLMVMLNLANEIRWMCVSISVLLHYFMLTCFAWMSVMAFDVMKTFVMENRASSGNFTFLKYCCYACGLPMVIVLTCLILDITDTVIFRYGTPERACLWSPNIIPGLSTLHVPVGLLILFDLIAITLTVRAIRAAKKASRMARSTGKQSITTPLLCVKLIFAMGVPWVLGLLIPFVDSRALKYIYIIMNSLQGFFIGVLFLTSKRTIKLIKKKAKPKNTAETGDVKREATRTTNV